MPTGSPYFDSSSQVIDQSKKGLLDAVAQGGTAGKQAFDAAQAAAAQAKQEAMARAAQRSALYGVGGNDQTFLGAYDARANQMGVNRANFESGLAQTQASGDAYLEKARAAIPVLQAVNANKAADTESKIKTAIAAAQQKALADQQKAAEAERRQIDRENRAEARSIARENRAAATKAAAPLKDPSAELLLAAGRLQNQNPLNKARLDANSNILSSVTMNPDVQQAHLAGQDMGYSPLQVQTALTPQKTNAYQKAVELPPGPDEKWLMSNVRGMDRTKAQQALAAPEMGWARDFINNTLANVQVDDTGVITAAPQGFEGLVGQKPADAFDAWVRSQRGNLTMKEGLAKYYGPTVAALFGR